YVLGNDPQHPNASIKVEKSAKIDANESITDLGEFQIYF
ncbi:MAG: hypothetical protein RJB36_1734, partial [Bacteroidota bacterium]